MNVRDEIKRDVERRTAIKKELAQPVRRHKETIEGIRRRNALRAELKQLDARLMEHKNAIIRSARPELILRTGW